MADVWLFLSEGERPRAERPLLYPRENVPKRYFFEVRPDLLLALLLPAEDALALVLLFFAAGALASLVFDVNDRALLFGAALFADIAMNVLQSQIDQGGPPFGIGINDISSIAESCV